MLSLYRTAIALRREHLTPVAATLEWQPTDPELLSFTQPGGFTFLANLSHQPVARPAGEILLASGPLPGGLVPPDTAVWLTLGRDRS